ncbi:MAG TPA: ParB/RepB/Spo0J family partition protein [Terriglobales bacterium]|nr:ParB/RepB/Spo0J family partition protein [Terriglobales bacterium]
MTTTAEKSAEEMATVEKAAPGPEKRRALGRGLESLLPGPRPVPGAAPGIHSVAAAAPGVIGELQAQASPPAGDLVLQVSVEAIDPNPYQTRNHETYDTEDGGNTLAELAESIRASGVIQPVTVRPAKEGRYVLITGERRWRASKLAGRDKVPALVRQVSDQQAAEMTVVENLQRQDLNCMDQARAFVMLSQTFHLTQEQIGNRVGVARETISNYMRLVRLPNNVQRYLQDGELEFSHARLLLILEDDSLVPRVADKVVKEKLSVEQLEEVVFQLNVPFKKQQEEQGTGRARWVDPNVRAAQRQLEQVLGMRVRIRDRKGKGRITIDYASLEDFDRVVKMLRGK